MPNLGMVGTLACRRAQTMGCCCGDRRACGWRGGEGGCGWETKSKATFNVIMELLCLFDTPSVCFPTVSLPPSLFLFTAQYLSTFHPLFSLCLLSLISSSLYLLLISLSLSEKEVAALQRWVYCGGRGDFFFFFLSEFNCQS